MPQPDPQKEFNLTFEHRPKYLYAYVTGERDSYQISRDYWQEVADHIADTDYNRLLIDEDIAEAASVADVYRLVSDLPGMGFAGVRIAFYDRRIEHHELNDFGALVASNRGLNGRVFNDVDKAISWLETS